MNQPLIFTRFETQLSNFLSRFGESLRYLLISVCALAIDIGLFSIFMRLGGLHYQLAATIGFLGGVTAAYLLSIAWVFNVRSMKRRPGSEFVVFVLIGVCGLGITQIILWLGISEFNTQAELCRLFAAGATFIFNLVVRKKFLFSNHKTE